MRRNRLPFAIGISIAAALAAGTSSGTARAAGLYVGDDSGVQAELRGGAFVARADDPSALLYNPAGLTQRRGLSWQLDVAVVSSFVTFERSCPCGQPDVTGPFPEVRSQASPLPIPTLGASYGLNDKLAFGLALWAPYAGHYTFPADGAQRYSVVQNNPLLVFEGLGVAYRPIPRLSLGATLEAAQLQVDTSQAITFYPGNPHTIGASTEDPAADGTVSLSLSAPTKISANFGAMFWATDHLSVGADVQLPISPAPVGTFGLDPQPAASYNKRAPITVSNSVTGMSSAAIGSGTTLAGLNLPLVVRAGVRWEAPRDRWDAELDAVYERWSSLSAFVITPKNIAVTVVGPPAVAAPAVTVPLDMQDAGSIRLGGSYLVYGDPGDQPAHIAVHLLGGVLFETGALPDQYLSVNTPDATKFGVSFGEEIRTGRLGFLLGASIIRTLSVDITDSKVYQQNAIDTAAESTVGNGTFQATWILLMAGVRGRF